MDLINYFKKVRGQSIEMVSPLVLEDFVPQVAFFASPPKWNLAHTTWFFEEFILKNSFPGYKLFHSGYSFLFNSYYEGAGSRASRDERGMFSRPTVDEIYKYREYVDNHMYLLFENRLNREITELVILGLNHEQQHQELFYTDLKYTFSRNPLYPVYSDLPEVESGNMPEQHFIKMDEGLYEIGYQGDGFAFDNEKPKHKVYLETFEISNRLVTNGEYLEFINDNGYNRHEFWHEEGWKWVKENAATHPLYWEMRGDTWFQFTLSGLRVIKQEQPLTHINFYEAFAYSQWKNMRLPTEHEWEAASDRFQWGDRWEWTESAYLPYPGYKKAEGTVGEYNGKFMVNQKVLRGASVVTPEGHARKTYRNFFHPHMGWQFNGIRLAK